MRKAKRRRTESVKIITRDQTSFLRLACIDQLLLDGGCGIGKALKEANLPVPKKFVTITRSMYGRHKNRNAKAQDQRHYSKRPYSRASNTSIRKTDDCVREAANAIWQQERCIDSPIDGDKVRPASYRQMVQSTPPMQEDSKPVTKSSATSTTQKSYILEALSAVGRWFQG